MNHKTIWYFVVSRFEAGWYEWYENYEEVRNIFLKILFLFFFEQEIAPLKYFSWFFCSNVMKYLSAICFPLFFALH